MLNTKSAIKSFLVRNVRAKFWQKNVEVDLRPYGTINAGEEKLEKISDAGAKMTLRQVAEDNIAAHQPEIYL